MSFMQIWCVGSFSFGPHFSRLGKNKRQEVCEMHEHVDGSVLNLKRNVCDIRLLEEVAL